MNTDFRRLNFRDEVEIKAGVKVLVSSSRSAKSAQFADKNSQHGIALVVTLILVSVTAFLAMTFLILSQRERGSVSVNANQTDARFAADAALERAKAELLAPILAFTNPAAYGLKVSTTYINPIGFDDTLPLNVVNPTNVNYEHKIGGLTNFDADERSRNIANLQYDPRVPVFITNPAAGGYEFRFYLDLNRNGRYDTNGLWPVISPGGRYYDTNGIETGTAGQPPPPGVVIVSNHFVGDPEWIGILERPELPHSPSNRFIARYAYLVVPAGKTLDVNYIHNQAKRRGEDADGFWRNQGVGTWEINLAAFLTDLNTNLWPPLAMLGTGYNYATNNVSSGGISFEDALSLLRYRYSTNNPPTSVSGNYDNLQTVSNAFGGRADNIFIQDNIDEYADGPLMTNAVPLTTDNDTVNTPWSGSDNPAHYFTIQDLFDPKKTSAQFVGRLTQAGATNASYDRYTYYRMLEQLGTDSAPDERMNLNYDNLVQTNAQGIRSATNLYPWRPLDFFANAANRLLGTLPTANYYATDSAGNRVPLSVTNIPLYPTNQNMYTPAVHRLLQVAANLYDATTNRVDLTNQPPYFPHVYRPIFRKQSAGGTDQVSIAGYVEVTNDAVDTINLPCLEAVDLATDKKLTTGVFSNYNVYNAPWVIGAKKGFPNFNEYFLQSALQIDRKLEFRRKDINGNPYSSANPVAYTNQLYAFSVSNDFRVVAWNSYRNAYPYTNNLQWKLELTNEFFLTYESTNDYKRFLISNDIPWTNFASTWPGFDPKRPRYSLCVLASNNVAIVPQTNIVFQQSPVAFTSLDPTITRRQQVTGFPLPHWWVNWKTKLRFAMVDNRVNRVVDYVSLSASEENLDVLAKLAERANPNAGQPQKYVDDGWATNRLNNSPAANVPTVGIYNQILVSEGALKDTDGVWTDDKAVTKGNKDKAIQFFAYNMGLTNFANADANIYKTNIFQAPYTPASIIPKEIYWQANDPLVHYTVSDLIDPVKTNVTALPVGKFISTTRPLDVTKRYRPWPAGETRYKLEFKDPLVWRSDNWEFPTNKLPNVGWVGRVHRGTPWQTLYLKSTPAGLNDWTNWTGNIVRVPAGATNAMDDGLNSLPYNDWKLFDLFTAAPNDNAGRGRLSVNQTNLAAWSAVLGGVVALNNSSATNAVYQPIVIEPAGSYNAYNTNTWPPLVKIVNGINRERTRLVTNGNNVSYAHPNGVFQHAGDVFATPELTVNSPFLNPTPAPEQPAPYISDAVYERIPQQILGLLKGDEQPRFVVYAYGQSLKPAERSIFQSSPFTGLCTNYQITSEVALRSEVRIEGFPTNTHAVVENFNLLPPD